MEILTHKIVINENECQLVNIHTIDLRMIANYRYLSITDEFVYTLNHEIPEIEAIIDQESGKITFKTYVYQKNNKIHRNSIKGPAQVIYNKKNYLKFESIYIENGKIHNLNGPAYKVITFDFNSEITIMNAHFKNGRIHRNVFEGHFNTL